MTSINTQVDPQPTDRSDQGAEGSLEENGDRRRLGTMNHFLSQTLLVPAQTVTRGFSRVWGGSSSNISYSSEDRSKRSNSLPKKISRTQVEEAVLQSLRTQPRRRKRRITRFLPTSHPFHRRKSSQEDGDEDNPQWLFDEDDPDPAELLQLSVAGPAQLYAKLPPDPVLNRADYLIVVTERLKGVTLDQIYDACWSDKTDFYERWATLHDHKDNVVVHPWERGIFPHAFDQHNFSQKRTVTYFYTRDPHTLGYNLGDPVVYVTQTHYYQTSDNHQRSILAMTVEMKGEVYADHFCVHIRGVATQSSDRVSILLDFGVAVEYLTPTPFFMKRQVTSLAQTATHETIRNLYQHMRQALPHAQPMERKGAVSVKESPKNTGENGDFATTDKLLLPPVKEEDESRQCWNCWHVC